MAHNLFGSRFLDNRTPAWHGLGQVVTDPLSAGDALDLIGDYEVEKVQVQTVDGIILPKYALMRRATADDPDDLFMGLVGEDYRLITPREFANLYDVAVGQPVETIGAIAKGAVMFITTKMPTVDIAGDEVEMYLVARNGMDGGHVAGVDISPVRVVCQNTLRLSADMATESFRVVHDAQAVNRLGAWMSTAYHGAVARQEAVAEAFRLLASTRVHAGQAEDMLEVIYPAPPAPARNAPPEVMEHRMATWERLCGRHAQWREAATELFAGAGTGMDSRAAAGTAWGLLAAVTETEDYRLGRGGEAGIRSTAENRMSGGRAQTKERGFKVVMDFAQGRFEAN